MEDGKSENGRKRRMDGEELDKENTVKIITVEKSKREKKEQSSLT